jgi:hypothetical protein
MNDQTKLALFDALLAYLIQSSTAMDGTIKALATGALFSPPLLVLNEAIDSAKVLLSKVIHSSINARLLLLCIVKSIEIDNEGDELMFERSDILAISSLPRLESLKIYGCGMTEEAHSVLVRCKGLNTLFFPFPADPACLAAIGRKLVSLGLWAPSKEIVDGIVESCPNLQYLELDVADLDDDEEK